MSRESYSRKNDERVRESVAAIIATAFNDPRLRLVTVTSVRVNADRSVAEVYVSAAPEEYSDALAGLESAKGRIRSMLGKNLGWRHSPELRFQIDETVDLGERIAEVLSNIPPTLASGADDVDGADGAGDTSADSHEDAE
ncbi:MAG: 30S ribosome-binding factor RbfA [Coriobacteriia bacterium]|nr:30S ribosome-binding factor RbfA [Coriobacteriia bacterium]